MITTNDNKNFKTEEEARENGYEKCANCGEWSRRCSAVDRSRDMRFVHNRWYCYACAPSYEPSELIDRYHANHYDYSFGFTEEYPYGTLIENLDGQLLMGVETETDPDYEDHDAFYSGYFGDNNNLDLEKELYNRMEDLVHSIKRGNFHVNLERDGSLSKYGIEVISEPASLEWYTNHGKIDELWHMFIDHNYVSHNSPNCGLHVHVSRSFFGKDETEQDLNISKLILLFNKFWSSRILPFSRRKKSELYWCEKNATDKIYTSDTDEDVIRKAVSKTKVSGDRYKAINLQNRNTVEFRMFKGTIKYSTWIATLQFVDTICRFSKKINLRDIDNVAWEDIFRDVDCPELLEYLQEKASIALDEEPVTFNKTPDRNIYRTYSFDELKEKFPYAYSEARNCIFVHGTTLIPSDAKLGKEFYIDEDGFAVIEGVAAFYAIGDYRDIYEFVRTERGGDE